MFKGAGESVDCSMPSADELLGGSLRLNNVRLIGDFPRQTLIVLCVKGVCASWQASHMVEPRKFHAKSNHQVVCTRYRFISSDRPAKCKSPCMRQAF